MTAAWQKINDGRTLASAIVMFFLTISCSETNFGSLSGNKDKDKDDENSKSAETSPAEESDRNVDAPIWINGASLTCDWNSINSDAQVSMDCGLLQHEKVPNPPADLLVYSSWIITDSSGKSVAFHRVTKGATPFDIVLSTQAMTIPGSAITVWIVADSRAYEYTVKFDDTLPGLKGGGKLGQCLLASRPLEECFAEAGLRVPSGEPVVGGVAIDSGAAASAFLTCPGGFIDIGSTNIGTTSFCVAKYEMKKSATGGIESVAANEPLIVKTAAEATALCAGLGQGYGLISNDQWMEIANQIENAPANWSSKSMGVGTLARGHSDIAPDKMLPAGIDDRDGCFMTGQACDVLQIFNDQRRTFILGNGQVIWDFSGNAAEVIAWNVSADKAIARGSVFNEWTELNQSKASVAMKDPLYKSKDQQLSTAEGIGGYYAGRTKADAPANGVITVNGGGTTTLASPGNVLRGGSKNDLLNAGIYGLAVDADPATAASSTGFRCTRQLGP
jgi:hypothetical protein